VAEFAAASLVPVLNAGDGAGEHPSQALLDIYTMREELGVRGVEIDGCTMAIVGDLRFGRTVHSLMKLLGIFEGVTFRLFSPPSLELPDAIAAFVRDRGHTVVHCSSVVEAVSGADLVYATRVQRERMTEELPPSLRGSLLDRSMLEEAGATDIVVMHPLPRDSRSDSYDLSPTVDDLPGLAIFHQTDNGIPVRMALFLTALGVSAEAVQMTLRQRPWDARLRWDL